MTLIEKKTRLISSKKSFLVVLFRFFNFSLQVGVVAINVIGDEVPNPFDINQDPVSAINWGSVLFKRSSFSDNF